LYLPSTPLLAFLFRMLSRHLALPFNSSQHSALMGERTSSYSRVTALASSCYSVCSPSGFECHPENFERFRLVLTVVARLQLSPSGLSLLFSVATFVFSYVIRRVPLKFPWAASFPFLLLDRPRAFFPPHPQNYTCW